MSSSCKRLSSLLRILFKDIKIGGTHMLPIPKGAIRQGIKGLKSLSFLNGFSKSTSATEKSMAEEMQELSHIVKSQPERVALSSESLAMALDNPSPLGGSVYS